MTKHPRFVTDRVQFRGADARARVRARPQRPTPSFPHCPRRAPPPTSADDSARFGVPMHCHAEDHQRHPERADAWLYRVATRAALREARRSGARRRAERALYERETAPAADESSADILVLLDGLPPQQRAALTLRYVFDLPDRAIAAAMGCRAATVRSHLFHGRAALRARLESQGEQPT